MLPDIAQGYAKLRGSPVFVFALLMFVGGWVCAHVLFNFDHAFGVLNLTLSTEASVSLAFFTMMGDRAAADQQRQTDALLRTLHDVQTMGAALVELADSQKDVLQENARMLKEITRS